MGCPRRRCSAERLFIFINIGFAMYAGALLATAARLAWDPSTYSWFRWLCAAQYRACAAYVLAAGIWLALLTALAAYAVHPRRVRALRLYASAVAALVLSEVGFGAWLGTSLWTWWRESPRAELARQGLDIVHDLKPVLLTLERHQELARALYEVIEETEREAPNNVFVIIVFALAGCVLQVAAVVAARRLWRDAVASPASDTSSPIEEHLRDPPQWRKKANLRMYTILDKIF